MPVSVADVWRVYSKRHTGKTKGALIFRKRGVIRKSKKVMDINRQFAQAKIAKEAHEKCLTWPGCTYEGRDGRKHCRIECFVRALREVASRLPYARGGAG